MDVSAGQRHTLAASIIDRAVLLDCRLTLQAISEFYAVSARKRLVPLAEAVAQAEDWLTMFRTVAASASAIRTALALAASGRTSYRDALLVATAAETGCTAILTENLADGSMLLGMRVLNPFSGDALSPAVKTLLTGD